jgi:pilus assembly protein CpaC
VNNENGRRAAAIGRRHWEWTGQTGRGAGTSSLTGRRLLARLATVAALGVLLAPATLGDAQAQRILQISGAKHTTIVRVTVGKTEDLRIEDAVSEVTVGDQEVADVTPLTDHSLSILGKKIGTTRVSLYSEGKRQIGIIDVEVSYDVSRLAGEIGAVAGPGIKVSSVNGRIMLSGTSPDAVTLDRAVTLARQFAPEIINSVVVLQPQQVMLEVRFIEVTRQASREFGVQWNVFNSKVTANIGSRRLPGALPITTPTSPTQVPVGEVAAGVLSGGSPFGFLLGRMLTGGTTIDVLINALEHKGLVRTLAEPNLVSLSGDTASFLAGGEYPIPVAGTNNAVTVDYKPYGVGLSFTPTVLKDGLINIVIKPEVSQIDPSNSVSVGSFSVPALIVRRARTTVELRDGQSFMIGGLLQNVSKANLEQLPWLGDVPVLGSLFRSASYQKEETDLAIIVTPRVVRPARPDDPIKTPLDNTLPANDADFFLMGKSEISKSALSATLGGGRMFTGHILDLPKGARHVVAVKN